MKFSDFLVEGLFDKYFEIPSEIAKIWNQTRTKGLRYPLIAKFLRDTLNTKVGGDFDVAIVADQNDKSGGSYTHNISKLIIRVSEDETPTDLDKIISTFMHELVHVIQGKNNPKMFTSYYSPNDDSDMESNLKYFFQSTENSAMVYGVVANLSVHNVSLAQVKDLFQSATSGEDSYKQRKVAAFTKVTRLKLFADGEQYRMWSYYLNTITYGYGIPKYKPIIDKWVSKIIKEYGNFLYLKQRYG